MSVSIDDLIGRVKSPVRSVTICLNADLQAEHDELNEQLEAMRREQATTMGGSGAGVEIATRLREIESEMRSSEQVFKFRGISSHAIRAIQDRFPAREGKREAWDAEAGSSAVIAACSVEPKMTEEQAVRLVDVLSHGQTDKLFTAAWIATTGTSSVPFSARASALLAPTAS